MTDEQQDQEWRAEAERLKLLDPQTQRDLVEMQRHLALNPKLTKKERETARQKADALARLLDLTRPTLD